MLVSEPTGGGVGNGRFREGLALVRYLLQSFELLQGPQRAVGQSLQHTAFPVGGIGQVTLPLGPENSDSVEIAGSPELFRAVIWNLRNFEFRERICGGKPEHQHL